MKKFKLMIFFLMLYGFFPLITLAKEEKYELWVSGIRVTDKNKDNILGTQVSSVIFNPQTNTLTLNNAIIEKADEKDIDKPAKIGPDEAPGEGTNKVSNWGIASKLENLKIVIKGTNRIGNVVSYVKDETTKTDYDFFYGIRLAGEPADRKNHNLVVTGDGSLTIYDALDGISADNITFDEGFTGNLNIYDAQFGAAEPPCAISATNNLTIENGNYELVSYNSNGINADNITINYGKVKIKALNYEVQAEENLTISDNLEVVNATYDDTSKVLNAIIKDEFVIIEPKTIYYTVTFDNSGIGREIPSVNVKSGNSIVEPNVPMVEDYTFVGWYEENTFENLFDFDTKITSNITLYAKWEKKEENPETYDNISLWQVMGLISISGIMSTIYTKKRNSL